MIKKIFFFSFVIISIRWQSPGDHSSSIDIFKKLDSLKKADNLEDWLNTCMQYNEPNTTKYVEFLSRQKPQIWRTCRNTNECLAEFYFPVTLGYYQMYTGNILSSIESYEEAYRFSVEKKIPDDEVLEYVMKPLGNNYTRLGDYDRALFIQQKGLQLSLHENNAQQAASFYSNLTTTCLSKGDPENAKKYCSEGLQLVKKDTSLYGYFLSSLAEVLIQFSQLPEAKEKVKEGIQVLNRNLKTDKQYTPYWLYGAYRTEGDILKQVNHFTEALRSYENGQKTIDHYFKGERKREKAKLIVAEGDVLLQLQQPDNAKKKYHEALSLLLPSSALINKDSLPQADQLYGENTLVDALKGMAKTYLQLDQKEKALDCFHLVLSGDRKLGKEFFGAQAKQKQQKEMHEWIETAIETAYQLWKTTNKKKYVEEALLFAEESKARLLSDEINANLYYNSLNSKDSLLQKQSKLVQAINFYEKNAAENNQSHYEDSIKKELQYELSLVQKDVREKYPVADLSLKDGNSVPASLLNDLPNNTSLIEFFTGEKAIYVFTASGNSLHIFKMEGADSVERSVNDFVLKWFQQGPSKMMNAPGSYYKDAWQIYAALLQPVIKKDERYIVVPDGVLGFLPFDALVTDSVYKSNIDDWPFLIRQTNLYYAYSLQTWQQLHEIKRNKAKFAGFFISFDSSLASSIPAVKKEYDAIHHVVNGDFFLDKNSSLQNFKDHVNDANILHISTHSFLQGDDRVPVLQFSNGKFFLFELYGKSFQPQLVVLSACRTGQGMLAEGEGILSLSRGFTASGTGGIIASLWNMNDEATADLIGNFYEQLQKNNLPADALRDAKLKWLEEKNSNQFQKLPYYWAGFAYSGDNEKIEIEPKKNTTAFVLIVAVVFLLALITFLFNRRARNKNGH